MVFLLHCIDRVSTPSKNHKLIQQHNAREKSEQGTSLNPETGVVICNRRKTTLKTSERERERERERGVGVGVGGRERGAM